MENHNLLTMGGDNQEEDDDSFSVAQVPSHMASSDLFTPFGPPRPTQSSVGCYLIKNRTEEDLTFGVHKAEYGGAGAQSCSRETWQNVPRTHNHLRTALDESIPPRVKEHNRKYIVAYNRGLYASPPEAVGDLVFQTHLKTHVDHDYEQVKRSIFPRSVVYELDYIKNEYRKKMLLALETERAEFEERVKRKRKLNEKRSKKAEEVKMMPIVKDSCPVKDRTSDSCDIPPPFWWPDKGAKRDFKSEAITLQEDYVPTSSKDTNFGTVDIKREMKLDDKSEYQPGQIHKQRLKESGVSSAPKTANAGWSPKNPDFHKPFDPSTFQMTSPLHESVKQRQKTPLLDPVKSTQSPAGENLTCKCKCHTMAVGEHLGKVISSSGKLKPQGAGCSSGKTFCRNCGCQIASKIGELEKLRPQDTIELLDRIDDDRRELAGKHLKSIGGSKPFPFPGEPLRYGPWDHSRQIELARAGLPFKTEAARWMEKNMDPLILDRAENPLIPWNITNL